MLLPAPPRRARARTTAGQQDGRPEARPDGGARRGRRRPGPAPGSCSRRGRCCSRAAAARRACPPSRPARPRRRPRHPGPAAPSSPLGAPGLLRALRRLVPVRDGHRAGRLRRPDRADDRHRHRHGSPRRTRRRRSGCCWSTPAAPAARASRPWRAARSRPRSRTGSTSSGSTRAGWGAARALQCPVGPGHPLLRRPGPRRPRGRGATEQSVERYDQSCGDTYRQLLPHLGTRDVARDMDALRNALGPAADQLPRLLLRHLDRAGLRRPLPAAGPGDGARRGRRRDPARPRPQPGRELRELAAPVRRRLRVPPRLRGRPGRDRDARPGPCPRRGRAAAGRRDVAALAGAARARRRAAAVLQEQLAGAREGAQGPRTPATAARCAGSPRSTSRARTRTPTTP